MKKVTGQVKGFGGVIQKNSAQIKKMGRQMTVAGAAIVGGLGMMVKAYGSFDEAMVRSLAIMGDVSPAMRKEMAKTAKELSTKSTFAAKDLAEAYYFLASAGMSAEASISALPPVSRFAQAGTFDLALATDLLTDAQTALGLSSKDVIENEKNLIRVSDVLVGANTLANASVLQFAESLTNKAAAAIVNLNKEVEEGVAVLAAYADKGVKGRLAGQRLTMMLNGLFDATRQNKEAWDEAGISLFNADESMRSIADIIQDLEGRLGSMTVKQREAELATLGFNIKTKDSILTLMGSSEKIRGWTEDLKEMGGITKTVADKQMEAFNAKMTVLKNVVIGAAIGIGQSLAPMIESLAEKIKNVAAKISAWIEWHPKLTAVIATTTLGIGALLLVLGPLMMMLPGLIAALPMIKAGFASLLGPLGLLIVAITAIAVGIRGLINIYKDLQDAEINAIVKASTPMGKAMALRKKLIADEVITIEEWAEIFNKHGRSYKRTLRAIATLPEYAHIKAAWDGVIKKQEEVETSIKKLGTTATTIFPSWATIVGKIFHETSVRAAEMRAKMKDVKLILPPVSVTIPKMSLEDFREWYKKWEANLMKDWPKTWKESFQMAIQDAALFTSTLSGLFNQMTENQMMNIEKEYEARKSAIENSLMTEKSKTDAMEKLDKEFEKKRLQAMRTQAARTKAVGIMEAIIHTASAVVEALPNIPLAIAVGIMGAIQTALIAAQPLPSFQAGGRIKEAGIVGERGPELFVPGTPGEIIPLRERATPIGSRVILNFNPSFYISSLDPQTVRDVVREQVGPELLDMLKSKIMLPEFQMALEVK